MGSKIFLGKYRVSAEEIAAAGEPGDRPLNYDGEEIDSGKKVVVETVFTASLKAEVREQLEASAIAVKKLNHVNVHGLYDFGVEDNYLVYVREDIEGTPVEEWVKRNGPLPVASVVRIAAQIVSALGAAGFHRIVHRAISPSNVLLVPGETAEGESPLVKVRNFEGIGSTSLGADGTTAFEKTVSYTSPEQLRYGIVDFRSEVYSLGATMWFLLTGAPPLMVPEGPVATLPANAGVAADKVNAMPEKIRRLLATMLSVNPSARPRDALAFYLQLQECMTEMGPRVPTSRRIGAPPDSLTRTAEMPAKRIPTKAIALAGVFLAITVLAALVLPGYIRHRGSVQTAPPIAARSAVPKTVVSPAPVSTAGPAVFLAPPKPLPQQQSPASAVNVTLVGFTPMVGMPGGKDFKIATLTFRIEASSPVTVTEASFYVDSVTFNDGSRYQPPITLLIHTGIFLGPPGTKVDPAHPMERTVWLKSQENLFPNWLLAYNQTENATFRWTIGGQPVGGSVLKPLHTAWSSPRPTPEVRRAEPAGRE